MRVDDDRSRYISSAITEREKANEGVVFFHAMERSAPAEPLIKDIPSGARRLAQRHVGANTQTAKGSNLKPLTVLVAQETSWLLASDASARF
jgi:hypothetical protein